MKMEKIINRYFVSYHCRVVMFFVYTGLDFILLSTLFNVLHFIFFSSSFDVLWPSLTFFELCWRECNWATHYLIDIVRFFVVHLNLRDLHILRGDIWRCTDTFLLFSSCLFQSKKFPLSHEIICGFLERMELYELTGATHCSC